MLWSSKQERSTVFIVSSTRWPFIDFFKTYIALSGLYFVITIWLGVLMLCSRKWTSFLLQLKILHGSRTKDKLPLSVLKSFRVIGNLMFEILELRTKVQVSSFGELLFIIKLIYSHDTTLAFSKQIRNEQLSSLYT